MCRLAWQPLGMLGNVLSRPRYALQRPRHVLQRPRHAWQCPRHAFLQGPRSPTSKKNTPTCCLISCEAKGVVYHKVSYMEAWWYTTPLASQLIRQQVGGFFFDVRLLGPCENACQGRCQACLGHYKACLKRCKACRERCQACLGVAKQAYTS